jgi:hypothetical protein
VEVYLPSDSLMKFEDDKRLATILYLYELVFDLARLPIL